MSESEEGHQCPTCANPNSRTKVKIISSDINKSKVGKEYHICRGCKNRFKMTKFSDIARKRLGETDWVT